MKIPAINLATVARFRGVTIDELASRMDIDVRSVDDFIELEENQAYSISKELAIPVQALFAPESLATEPVIDFRAKKPAARSFDRGVYEAIAYVEGITAALGDLDLDTSLSELAAPVNISGYTRKEAAKLAKTWRNEWGMTTAEQLNSKSAGALYSSLRTFVESLGILVVHRPFKSKEASGFYLQLGSGPHVIAINQSKSSKARKLFTLAHEFCHVLLRKEGVSNVSVTQNRIEKFCNWFAARLLAPKRTIETAIARYGYSDFRDNDEIRLLAKNIGISQESLVLRLVEVGRLEQSDYLNWKSQFSGYGNIPSGDQSDGGGGGSPPDVIKTKLSEYGSTFIRLLRQAVNEGQIDEIDVYRVSGLKPKYQDQVFETA